VAKKNCLQQYCQHHAIPRTSYKTFQIWMTPNELPILHAPSHWWRHLYPSDYCTNLLNLNYQVQLIHTKKNSTNVMGWRFWCVMYLYYGDSYYTMSQGSGTEMQNATFLFQNQPYSCRTLVVNLWHTAGGWDKGQCRKGVKQVFRAKQVLTAELYILLYGKATD